jgi:hypothetical protein
VTDIGYVVRGFANALFKGEGALFLGAGISVPSKLPDWFGLLEPLVAPLGIKLERTDDFPLMAQHVVNYYKSNRGPLIGALRAALEGKYAGNRYHAAIAAMDVRTIWTTNFDTLIERELKPREQVAVRASDSDLTAGSLQFDRELLKMHGCIERSSPPEFVLTTEDFEDYAARRPVFAARLNHELQHTRFLFAGYGLGDPNIRTAVGVARRLAGNASRHHLMITRVDPKATSEIRRRTELWLEDLRRVGIDSATVAEYSEVEDAFEEISVRARGRSVFVTGSHLNDNDSLAQDLGKRLALLHPPVRLLDGQSAGIGRTVANAFGTVILHANQDLRDRVRFFPNPYAVDASMSNDPALLPKLKAWRASLFRSARTVVVFDGGMGTRAEVDVAQALKCNIIPVPRASGGLAAELLTDLAIRGRLAALDPSYVGKAESHVASVDDVVAVIEKSLA